MGGPIAADEHFDEEFFINFRSKNLVQVAIEYAQVCYGDILYCTGLDKYSSANVIKSF